MLALDMVLSNCHWCAILPLATGSESEPSYTAYVKRAVYSPYFHCKAWLTSATYPMSPATVQHVEQALKHSMSAIEQLKLMELVGIALLSAFDKHNRH